jgi:hypothetical protein
LAIPTSALPIVGLRSSGTALVILSLTGTKPPKAWIRTPRLRPRGSANLDFLYPVPFEG